MYEHNSDRKNDKDIEDFYFLFLFYYGKSMRIRVGKATDGQNDFLVHVLSIKIRERHRDLKGHSNNKVIITL